MLSFINPAQMTARKIECFDAVFVDDGQFHLEFPLSTRFTLGPSEATPFITVFAIASSQAKRLYQLLISRRVDELRFALGIES